MIRLHTSEKLSKSNTPSLEALWRILHLPLCFWGSCPKKELATTNHQCVYGLARQQIRNDFGFYWEPHTNTGIHWAFDRPYRLMLIWHIFSCGFIWSGTSSGINTSPRADSIASGGLTHTHTLHIWHGLCLHSMQEQTSLRGRELLFSPRLEVDPVDPALELFPCTGGEPTPEVFRLTLSAPTRSDVSSSTKTSKLELPSVSLDCSL